METGKMLSPINYSNDLDGESLIPILKNSRTKGDHMPVAFMMEKRCLEKP